MTTCVVGRAGDGHPSFYDLVGEREQGWRHVEAERLSGLEVDHKLELGWLHDRQVGGQGAFQYATDVSAGLKVLIDNAGAIAQQTTVCRKIAPVVDCRNPITLGEFDDLLPPAIEKRIGRDEERAGAFSVHGRKSVIELMVAARFCDVDLNS